MNIAILSAGAAMGLIRTLEPDFRSATGLEITGVFGAVGAMQEKLASGAPCDVIILTEKLIQSLAEQGAVDAATITKLGTVSTGLAVPSEVTPPQIGDKAAVAQALTSASAVYMPDPARSTAGIHFMHVIRTLGVQPTLRAFPNGATAMRELASSGDRRAIGCTQVTEILYTDGVRLVGPLPDEIGLATSYAAAIVRRTTKAEAARTLISLLGGPVYAPKRVAAGFAV